MHGPRGRSALAFILAVFFLDMLGATILMPVAPYIVRHYSGTALDVALLTVIYSAAQFLAAPVLGRLSDRYGRRPVLLVSVLGSAAGYLTFGLGGALWVLFLSRLIDGVTGGNISTAMAYIADVTAPEERVRYFALSGAVAGLGWVLGPAIGGVLAGLALTAPVFASAFFCLAAAALGFVALPESLAPAMRDRRPLRILKDNPISAIADMIRRPGLGLLLAALFVLYLAFAGVTSNLGVFIIERFGALPAENAIALTIVGLTQVVFQGVVVPRLAPSVGEKRLALVGLVVQAIGFLAVLAAPSVAGFWVVAALIGAGAAPVRPALLALTANRVPARDQGKLAGVIASLMSLTNVFGPLAAGAGYDHVQVSSPYWAAAALTAVAMVLLMWSEPRPAPLSVVPE